MPPSPLIDLSDLDPLAPSSSARSTPRTGSPPRAQAALFPPPPPSTSSNSSSASSFAPPVPRLAQEVRVEDVRTGEDPLGELLSGLEVGSSSSATQAGAADRVRRAQEAREERVLQDLQREPFKAAKPPPLAFVDEPASLLPSSSTSSSSPAPVSIPSSPRRRPSMSHTSFSPPRRLSSLMDLSSSTSSHAPSSPPAESSVFADPFHSPGHSRNRTRTKSGGKEKERGEAEEWEKGIEQAMQGEISAEWGDFQDAVNEAPSNGEAGGGGGLGGSGIFGSLRSSSFPSAASASATLSTAASAFTTSLATNTHSTLSSFFSQHTQSQSQSAHISPLHSPDVLERKPPPQRAATTGQGGFDPAAQPIRLVGVRPGVVRVLEEDVAEGIRPALPPRLRLSPRWTLLYSLDQHGISLQTLFTNLSRGLKDRDGGFVLVVKSERGEVFGGYCSEALKDSSASRDTRAQRWSGDGSCFLWKSVPFPPSDFRLGSSVRVFKPTFRNTYFQHASSQFLAFGGGEDGVFGLWIDGVFERGWTGTCETYRNEPLVDVKARGGEGEKDANGAGKQETGKFEVVGFECWAVGS
ncbi:oxidation resistance protein 1 [Rhodotorula toruloides]|nr:TLD-domain containing protein [Rhodotorula toruloides]